MLERVGGLLARVGLVVAPRTSASTAAATRTACRRASRWRRIVSACDAYNAMTTDRSYRRR